MTEKLCNSSEATVHLQALRKSFVAKHCAQVESFMANYADQKEFPVRVSVAKDVLHRMLTKSSFFNSISGSSEHCNILAGAGPYGNE